MIKVLFCDLDGTLWHEENQDFLLRVDDLIAIQKLLDNDIRFCIATGRGDQQARKVQYALNMHNLDMVCKNGSSIIANEKEIGRWTISKKDIIEALKCAKEYLNVTVLLTTSIGGMAVELRQDNRVSNCWPKVKRVDIAEIEKIDEIEVYKATVMTENNEQRAIAHEIIKRNMLPIRSIINQLGNVEWVHESCSKGKAIEYYCQYMGILLDEVAFIGDEINDIEAMKIAGVSFCIDTAPLEVQKEADFIVRSVHDAIDNVLKK